MAEGLASGEVVPLPLSIFPKERAADAFRFMAGGALASPEAPWPW